MYNSEIVQFIINFTPVEEEINPQLNDIRFHMKLLLMNVNKMLNFNIIPKLIYN